LAAVGGKREKGKSVSMNGEEKRVEHYLMYLFSGRIA